MSGLNKKGPENAGPMTGRKQGNCVSDNSEASQIPTGRGLGIGRGGQGAGRGRGICRGVDSARGRGAVCGMGRGSGPGRRRQ